MITSFKASLQRHLPASVADGLEDRIDEALKASGKMKFNLLFSSLPRLVGRQELQFSGEELDTFEGARPGFRPRGWTADRFCRVYLLLRLSEQEAQGTETAGGAGISGAPGAREESAAQAPQVTPDAARAAYVARIEELFSVADMAEQVALYSALPFYRYPEAFRFRATEGIRTNITDVFDAVALENPYPLEYLEEPAWNQMVLKALFMQRPLYRIYGLDKRANQELAHILSDYAHERWSAGRTVSPELWRCFGPFMDAGLFSDIERLLQGKDPYREEAAVLACASSEFPGAKTVLERYPALAGEIAAGKLSWDILGERLAGS